MKIVLISLLLSVGFHLSGQERVVDLLTKIGTGKNTYVIIIANEDYQSNSSIYVENEELAIYQAERFQQLLINSFGVLPQNIIICADAVNTHIKLAIAKLIRSIPQNSNFIFYYRGKVFVEKISGRHYLVPVDVSDNETFYMLGLDDLCNRLKPLDRNGISIFIDALPNTKSGTKCIIENGYTEGEIVMTAGLNTKLFRLSQPQPVTVVPDLIVKTEKPIIKITEPNLKNTQIFESSVLISGKVESVGKIDFISVGGQEAHSLSDGSFMARVILNEGENLISIEARNSAGLTREYVTFLRTTSSGNGDSIVDSSFNNESSFDRFGKYYAVIIGVSKYKDAKIPDLYYPIFDARKVREVLINEYTFNAGNVVLLENPLKGIIIRTLDSLNGIITNKDNLLIFYAGHGTWDESSSMGYWLPADAASGVLDNWIMNSLITGFVSQCNARHVLVIADACFGGSIFRTRAFKPMEEETISDLYFKTSKKAMTSGDLTEVPDISVFVKNFVQVLTENNVSYLPSQQLFFEIKPKVVITDNLIPQFGVIKNSGDEGGDFIFYKRIPK